ncbi:GntR family transcriptional regulator [Variovorax sp. WS11]|uniref:amidohydrolase family protein n=1 Tax=Variovorax sp. WS11 TaxID=1105204 RepID=UPI000D0DA80C|nr:amidohydrolase family protein [Variovorax sp. WS11]NDZ19032.1 amidohydrolase family protein [Variovorax sp. WS11]PSL85041.1 GntR family transcriptional regulator [Variovorax sp. WS11]
MRASVSTEPAAAPPLCLAPDPAPRAGRVALPPGATDCHCHVFEDAARYPLVPSRSYTPAHAPLAAYLRMCEAVGITRTVQVNASVYGTDNRITLDAIAALGQHRARGVAGLSPDVTAREIEALHEGGMRGVRLSTHVAGYGGTELIEAMARKLEPFGWHLQIHVAHGRELAELEARLLAVPAPLVFDHLGCVTGAEGVDSIGFQALLRVLARRDDCWVKLSSWYRRSADAEGWFDIRPLAQALVQARPDRVLFGTNWPHPNLFAPQRLPREAALIDSFCDWVPDAARREAILVRNPERLYGFAPTPDKETTR